MGRVIIPYFERKRLSLKALTPRDLETFFRYERQQEEATVQQLLDWHRELTDALQYAVDSNWLKANPVKTVDPCLDNSPVLFNDFLMDWLKMMKSRVQLRPMQTTRSSSRAGSFLILSRSTTPCKTLSSTPSTFRISISMSWIAV